MKLEMKRVIDADRATSGVNIAGDLHPLARSHVAADRAVVFGAELFMLRSRSLFPCRVIGHALASSYASQ
jgi:hypothetical protein